MIDHRACEGVGAKGTPLGPGTLFEAPIYTCGHCQRGVVVNPLRTRDRAYCPKCDHVICDLCEGARIASGGECRSFDRIADEILNLNARKGSA